MSPQLVEVIEAANDLAILLEGTGDYYYDEVEEKRWVLGDGGESGNCEYCDGNADLGWVDMDAIFDSPFGDIDGPPAHPHCTCEQEDRTRRYRVYTDDEDDEDDE